MDTNEKAIFYSVLGCTVIEYLWSLYLDYRQKKVEEENTNIPNELIGILSSETFNKSRVYGIDRRNFSMVRDTISMVFHVAFLLCNGYYVIWELGGNLIKYFGYEANEKNEILQSAAWVLISTTISSIIELPFSIYYTFVLEEKHGFNKQTVPFFIKDKLKAYILQEVLILPLYCGIAYIVKIGGDYFFLYVWLFVLLMTLFIYTIYPDLIAPLFDKYIHMPPGDLRTEVEKFAKSLNFPLSDLYVVIGSKRSAHSNAYFYGFFKKRIVLFDTLLKDFDPNTEEKKEKEKVEDEDKDKDKGKHKDTDLDKDLDKKKNEKKESKGCDNYEVLAVLAHEMGHWKLSHNLKMIFIGQVNILFVLIIFAKLYKYAPIYRAFGFYNSVPVLMGLNIVLKYVLKFYTALATFLTAMLSRSYEFQADKFAKSHGRGHYLKKSLIKLHSDNLQFPIYDPLFSAWYNSHPPLLERLQALDKED